MDAKRTIARMVLAVTITGTCSFGLYAADPVTTDSLRLDRTVAIAVVVNPQNPVTDLSRERLRKMYLGKSTVFENGEPVVPFEIPVIRDLFYDRVAGMSVRKLRKYWMRLIFSGETARAPKSCRTMGELKAAMSKNEGAIGFIHVTAVDSLMKVVSIDGRYPTDEDYLLKQ